MTVRLNGTAHETGAGTIGALLDELRMPRQAALVEHNGNAAPRSAWDITPLREGDRVEVLRVAAGG